MSKKRHLKAVIPHSKIFFSNYNTTQHNKWNHICNIIQYHRGPGRSCFCFYLFSIINKIYSLCLTIIYAVCLLKQDELLYTVSLYEDCSFIERLWELYHRREVKEKHLGLQTVDIQLSFSSYSFGHSIVDEGNWSS